MWNEVSTEHFLIKNENNLLHNFSHTSTPMCADVFTKFDWHLTFLLVENNFQLKFHLVRETFLNLLFVLLLCIRPVEEMTWAACLRRCRHCCCCCCCKQLNKIYKYIQMSIEVLSCPSVRLSVLSSHRLTLLHNLRAWISCQIHEPIRAINNWIAICLRIAEHKVRVCKGKRVQWMNDMSAVYMYVCISVSISYNSPETSTAECLSRQPAVQLSNSGSTAIVFWVLDKELLNAQSIKQSHSRIK